MNYQTLSQLIYNAKNIDGSQDRLTEEQADQLFDLLSKRCKADTKDRLYRRLKIPLACWPEYGIFNRLHFEQGEFSYCAGQCYITEIKLVRELIIKG